MGSDRAGRRGLRAVAALVIAMGVLVVLALATQTDEPTVREQQGRAPADRPTSVPAQIRANLEQGDALLDTPLSAKLEALEGVPVVVNQWASWCPPCEAEFPFFAELAKRYERRVAFLGVNSRDERGPAEAFLREHPVTFPSVFDERAEQARSIGAGVSWPTTVFFDAGGDAVFVRQGGYATEAALEADIRQHALGLG